MGVNEVVRVVGDLAVGAVAILSVIIAVAVAFVPVIAVVVAAVGVVFLDYQTFLLLLLLPWHFPGTRSDSSSFFAS